MRHASEVIAYPQKCHALRLHSTFNNYLRRFNLENVWKFVIENNTGGTNTYHNNYHMMAVAVRSLELLHMEVSAKNYEFTNQEEILFVAGMFHDMNHSGGVEEDSVNIEMALAELDKVGGTLDTMFYEGFTENVERVIQVTQYPFIIDPECLDEKIIRDADMLYSLEPNGVTIIMEELRNEMVPKFGRLPDREEWFDLRITFIEDVEFFTQSAKQIWADGIEESNKAMRAYANMEGL